MIDYKDDLNLKIILKWHKGLLLDTQKSIAGITRVHDIRVAGSKQNFQNIKHYIHF